MADCLIGMGSNLGDRTALLDQAVAALVRHPRIHDVQVSAYHRTEPVGGPEGQSEFLNAVARLETSLAPRELLDVLQHCETQLGRQRLVRWGPRAIDLDILLYDQVKLDTPSLQLPHPRMAFRRFVLEPAVEVAAGMVHPTVGWTLARLLDHLRTTLPYTALAGHPGDDRPPMVRRIAADVQAGVVGEPGDDQRLVAALRGSTGRCLETALEFLNRRAGWLRQMESVRSRDRQHSNWISDFSLDQMPFLVEPYLPSAARDAWRERFGAQQSRVCRPRLLVVLGELLTSADTTGISAKPLAEQGGSLERPRREMIDADIARWYTGPVLSLRGISGDQATAEVKAAILAMQ